MLVLEKNTKVAELQKQIKDIDIKLDILDVKYSKIQNHRKSQGLSLAIYKCSDPEALQLIQINNKTKELERLQDQLLKEKREESDRQFYKGTCELIKSYGNKKYKVKINNKVVTMTDNFHEAIKNTKVTDSIKVSKLVECNNSKYLPHEVNFYSRKILEGKIFKDRDYISDDGKLLDHQRYCNNELWWREIQRKNEFYYAFNTLFNVEFINLCNIKGNYSFYIDLDKKYIRTYTNISIGKSIEGIPDIVEWQEKFNKLINKYKKDKYLKDILLHVGQIQNIIMEV